MATVTDSATGRKTTYYYDLTDRLMKYVETGTGYSHSAGYEYDSRNNLTKLVETINGVEHTTSYAYDENDRITRIAADSADQVIGYDAFGRIEIADVYNASNKVIDTQYTYVNGATAATSSMLSNVNITAASGSLEVNYTYDDNGNITYYCLIGPESLGGISSWMTGQALLEETYYHYDSANQLIREDNRRKGITTLWEYDDAGNIITYYELPYMWPHESANPQESNIERHITYADSSWGDLLTGYSNSSLSYDGIGNLLSDRTWTYTWKHGRQLATMSDGATTWTYTYDANGMRTSRTNGTTTYNYVYMGSRLSQMSVGNDTLYFTYGVNGPTTVTWNGTTYYYAVNGQGDVIGIFDGSGNCVVAYYSNNAWGLNPQPAGTLANTLGTLNPLRYRGYVYDQETGLYYLQSRYYNPKWGRFLNADTYISTGQGILGNNMFAYCRNNPVTRKDASGTEDVCVENFNEDNNPLNDLGNPTGGGSGRGYSNSVKSSVGSFKTGNSGQKLNPNQSTPSQSNSASSQSNGNGWKVGQDITKPTSAGNKPSWSTVRQRFWKNEAYYNPGQYSYENLELMRKGRAPKDAFGYPMELHHPYGRLGNNFFIFRPVTHAKHIEIHYGG